MTPSRVTRLPTSALRAVKQPSGKAAREHRQAFRAAHPWPGEFQWPSEREAHRRRAERQAVFGELNQTPELAIILAMFRTLPVARIEAVRLMLDHFPDASESPALLQARAILDAAAEARRSIEIVCMFEEESHGHKD